MSDSKDEEGEEQKSAGDYEEDHFQCETGDAEAAIDGVSPNRREKAKAHGSSRRLKSIKFRSSPQLIAVPVRDQ